MTPEERIDALEERLARVESILLAILNDGDDGTDDDQEQLEEQFRSIAERGRERRRRTVLSDRS